MIRRKDHKGSAHSLAILVHPKEEDMLSSNDGSVKYRLETLFRESPELDSICSKVHM